MTADTWSMVVLGNESKGPTAREGPGVRLGFTDQPAPAPDAPPQPPGANDDVDYPGYDDPHGEMPVTMRICRRLRVNKNRILTMVELGSGGDPILPPGGGVQVPVPGSADDSDLDMP